MGHPKDFGVLRLRSRTGSSTAPSLPALRDRSGLLRGCDFFVSCDSVVPLKRDSSHLSLLYPAFRCRSMPAYFHACLPALCHDVNTKLSAELSIVVGQQMDRAFRSKNSASE